MIFKLLDPELLQTRPSINNKSVLDTWRSLVISQIEKSKTVSQKTLDVIQEKFLKPQEWIGTAKSVTKGANIAAEDEVIIDGWANVTDPDRAREIILSSAWKTANFDNNPIILFNHNHSWPIGTCEEYKIEDKGFYYRASIGKPSAYPHLTDMQMMCRSLLAQGILRASSVGFLPVDLEYDEVNDIIRYTDVELLEISLVSVPMQQGSLLDSVGTAAKQLNNTIEKRKKSMDKAQFDEMMAKLGAIFEAVTKPKEEPPKEPPKPPVEEGCSEENKALKAKIEELEKNAAELLDSLQKQGIKLN